MSAYQKFIDHSNLTPSRIKVIGVGGCGSNVVESMIQDGAKGMELISADAYSSFELNKTTHRMIQLRQQSRLDGSAESAFYDAEDAEGDIRNAIENTSMLFISAGMAGTTGAEAAPVIARIARQMGIVTVGVAIMPFAWEGGRRMKTADTSLAKLTANIDAVVELSNERMVNYLEGYSIDDAFASANYVVKSVLSCIADAIDKREVANLKYESAPDFVGASYKFMVSSNPRLNCVDIHTLRSALYALCNERYKTG